MSDLHRLYVGFIGTVAGITLSDVAQGAAIAASVATVAFMLVSTLEKLRGMIAREKADREENR